MPSTPRYLIEVKRRAVAEVLAPLPSLADAERALVEIAQQPGVHHARLVAEQPGDGGGVIRRVIRVVEPGTPPTTRAADGDGEAPDLMVTMASPSAPPVGIEVVGHEVVYHQPGEFSAWPANNGGQAWHWGDEILIAFFNAVYQEKDGHNWAPPTRALTARSTDGGESWTTAPLDLGGAGPAPGELDFADPDLALRVTEFNQSLYVSFDRGRTWPGPYGFGELLDDSPVAGDEFTARTDYLVRSSDEVLLFMSAKRKLLFREDYVYVARTRDGGGSFEFVAFVDPFDLKRNVMPSTVRTRDGRLIMCTRREDGDRHWVACYRSDDDGRSWASLGQVDSTGDNNGNPPALVRLGNGHLVCVYGVRPRSGTQRISAKVSVDEGRSWGSEIRLRTDFVGPDAFGDTDLGYPRAFVRPDGKVVAVYYWATAERPEQHIAATLFRVTPPPSVVVGTWRRGLKHPAVAGVDRILLLTLHYVEKGASRQPVSVRYGGQTMLGLLGREQKEGERRTYVGLFYLKESDIRKANGHRFTVDWQPGPPDSWQGASVYLSHVDQVEAFGEAADAGITKGRAITCGPLEAVPAGDAVIVAATARKRGRFFLADGYVKGRKFSLTRGGVGDDGSAVVGHRQVPETADQRAGVAHGNPGTMVAGCVQIRQAGPRIA